jgi:hypothetical protein
MQVDYLLPSRLRSSVVAAQSLPEAAPVELVQSLFDLTAAEAHVARSFASGKTVEDIAGDTTLRGLACPCVVLPT